MMLDAREILISVKRIGSQFQNLDSVHPALWPTVPRYVVLCLIFSLVVLVSYLFILSSQWEELNLLRVKEDEQKKEFINTLTKAQNLEQLRVLKNQYMQQVSKLEQQVPDKASIDAVLTEINQAGMNRGLQFESFKPGEIETKEFVAELPITIKMTGSYHALASFVSDVANLSRLVVIDHISMMAVRDGFQSFDAVIRTFYQIDSEESAKKKKMHNEKSHQAQS